MQAEGLGPARAEGAPWEAEGEGEVEEVLLGEHASSAASGQLQNKFKGIKTHHSHPEFNMNMAEYVSLNNKQQNCLFGCICVRINVNLIQR